MSGLWRVREVRTVIILLAEIAVLHLVPLAGGGRSHPFLNGPNALLILKYSSIYGIAAMGAAIVIISGGVDLSPGAVIALAGRGRGQAVRGGRLRRSRPAWSPGSAWACWRAR